MPTATSIIIEELKLDPVLLRRKFELAEKLGIPQSDRVALEQQSRAGLVEEHETIRNIINSWASKNGKAGNVHQFINVLNNMDCKLVAERVQNRILENICVTDELAQPHSINGASVELNEQLNDVCRTQPMVEQKKGILVAFLKSKQYQEANLVLQEILQLIPQVENTSSRFKVFESLYDIGSCVIFSNQKAHKEGKWYFLKLLEAIELQTAIPNIIEIQTFIQSKHACCLEEEKEWMLAIEYYSKALVGFRIIGRDRYAKETNSSMKRVVKYVTKEKKSN